MIDRASERNAFFVGDRGLSFFLMIFNLADISFLLPCLAEETGFEPAVPCGTPAFQASAFDRSATPPPKIRKLILHLCRLFFQFRISDYGISPQFFCVIEGYVCTLHKLFKRNTIFCRRYTRTYRHPEFWCIRKTQSFDKFIDA